jgi:hypothetical protein
MCVIVGYNDKTISEVETWHAVCHIMCHISAILNARLCSVCQTAASLVFFLYFEGIQNTGICNQLFSLFNGRLFLNQQSKVHTGIHPVLTQ